jgi:hypothetical protein
MRRAILLGWVVAAVGVLMPTGCGKSEAGKQPRINGPVDPSDKPEGRGGPTGGPNVPAGKGAGGVAVSGGLNKK